MADGIVKRQLAAGINRVNQLFWPQSLPAEASATVDNPPTDRNTRSPFIGGFRRNAAKIDVTADTALTYDAVWGACRVIGEDLGVLNWHTLRRTESGGKERVTGTPLSNLLRHQPNPEMTAFTFRETLTQHALLGGNGYAEIERNLRGEPMWLWPLLPDRTKPIRLESGELWYVTWDHVALEWVPIPAANMFHLKGPGYNGLLGYDVITYMSGDIASGIAARDYQGAFFGNGAHLSGALSIDGQMTEEAQKRLRNQLEELYTGSQNAFRVAIFEEGAEWKQMAVSPDASRIIELRKLNVRTIARIFRIQAHKIVDLEDAHYNNIEEQNIDHVQDTILPWATRWEQEANAKLLTPSQKKLGYETKLKIETLERGDIKTRYEAYQVGREWGWLSANDILRKEGENPIGAQGDIYIVPINFQSAELLTLPLEEQVAMRSKSSDNNAPDKKDEADKARAMIRPAILAAIRKVFNREKARGDEILKAARKGASIGDKRLSNYVDAQKKYFTEELSPIVSGALHAAGLKDDHRQHIIEKAVNAYAFNLRATIDTMVASGADSMAAVTGDMITSLAGEILAHVTQVYVDEQA